MHASRTLASILVVLLFPAAASAQFIIRNNNTGGDCQGLMNGNWNIQTSTCTLRIPVVGTIDILADRITLDGAGMLVTVPPKGAFGIRLVKRTSVEVTNVVLTTFTEGIVVAGGSSNRIHANRITAGLPNGCGICLRETHHNRVSKNTVAGNKGRGIELSLAHDNLIELNTVSKNVSANINMTQSDRNGVFDNDIEGDPAVGTHGINMRWGNDNTFSYNRIHDHRWAGLMNNWGADNTIKYNWFTNNNLWFGGVVLFNAPRNKVLCNDFAGNAPAIAVSNGAAANEIWWNNFFAQDTAIDNVGAGLNRFNQPLPDGGNYWLINAPNCADQNKDGFCDAPYVFIGNQDALPHVGPIPWKENPNYCEPPLEPIVPADVIGWWDEWIRANDGGTPAAMAAMLADDVVLSVGGRPDARGPAAFVEEFRNRFGGGGPAVLAPGHVEIKGSAALIRGGVMDKSREQARFVMILRRHTPGKWQIGRLLVFGEPQP